MVQEWRIRVSITVPPACEAGALPFELIPRYYSPFIRLTNNLLTKTGKIGQLQIVFNARHIQDGANQQTLPPSVQLKIVPELFIQTIHQKPTL